jgi:hypothetical protein
MRRSWALLTAAWTLRAGCCSGGSGRGQQEAHCPTRSPVRPVIQVQAALGHLGPCVPQGLHAAAAGVHLRGRTFSGEPAGLLACQPAVRDQLCLATHPLGACSQARCCVPTAQARWLTNTAAPRLGVRNSLSAWCAPALGLHPRTWAPWGSAGRPGMCPCQPWHGARRVVHAQQGWQRGSMQQWLRATAAPPWRAPRAGCKCMLQLQAHVGPAAAASTQSGAEPGLTHAKSLAEASLCQDLAEPPPLCQVPGRGWLAGRAPAWLRGGRWRRCACACSPQQMAWLAAPLRRSPRAPCDRAAQGRRPPPQ